MFKLLLISLILEGIVISEPSHPNLDNAVRTVSRTASFTQNNRTAYVLAKDGDDWKGMKLVFQHSKTEAAKLERYSHVRIDISGAVVDEDGRVVRGIPDGAVLSVEPGRKEDVPVRTRRVSELTDDDLYTWVSVPDCEFVFKDGAYCNILESYAFMMGTWQTLLTDSGANPLYAIFNTNVPWRRKGNGVPQGKGTVEGIFVRSEMLHYGDVNAPQIRVLDEEDFKFTVKAESSFKTICEWNWNDNNKEFFTDEEGRKEKVTNQTILPDKGDGRLYVDFEASVYRGRDLNNPVVEPEEGYKKGKRGQINYGSLQVRTKAKNWWNWIEDRGSAVVVQFAADKIKGDCLLLDFSFAAGDNSATTTRMCPVYWGVEVSTDNVNFTRIDIPDITLRAMPWWEKKLDGVTYYTSAECGLGLTEHQILLPQSLIGEKNVYVRIMPVRKNALTLAMRNSDNGALRPDSDVWTFIEFGTISIRYK